MNGIKQFGRLTIFVAEPLPEKEITIPGRISRHPARKIHQVSLLPSLIIAADAIAVRPPKKLEI
jgi:hypothetical protein